MPIKMEKPTLKKVGEEEAIKQAFIAPPPLNFTQNSQFRGWAKRERVFHICKPPVSCQKKEGAILRTPKPGSDS